MSHPAQFQFLLTIEQHYNAHLRRKPSPFAYFTIQYLLNDDHPVDLGKENKERTNKGNDVRGSLLWLLRG